MQPRRGRSSATAALAALALATLPACLLPPTTYGIRSAGDIGEAGDGRLTGTGMVFLTGDGTGLGGGGVDGEVAVHDRVALAASVGWVSGLIQAELELRAALHEGDRGGLTLLGGTSTLFAPSVTALVAPHVGLVGWRGYDDGLRIYAGAVYNPVGDYADGNLFHWIHGSLGLVHRFPNYPAAARPTYGLELGPTIVVAGSEVGVGFLGQIYFGTDVGRRKAPGDG